MFFIQIGNAAGQAVTTGIADTVLFTLPVKNINTMGFAEMSKLRTMELGNNITVVCMDYGELDESRHVDRQHPLSNRKYFDGFNADGLVDGSQLGAKAASTPLGHGASFGGNDVLSYASQSPFVGGGGKVQLAQDSAGPSAPSPSNANGSGSGSGNGQASPPTPSAAGGGGPVLDPVLLEDPLFDWAGLGMFQNVSVNLQPALKHRLTEMVYDLVGAEQGDQTSHTTMYLHNALAQIAKEVYSFPEASEPSSPANSTTSKPASPKLGKDDRLAPPLTPRSAAEMQEVERLLDARGGCTIIVGSDMGYTATTLYRVAAIVSEVATFLGYPSNDQYLRTTLTYIRKLMLEGNLSILEQGRERLGKSVGGTSYDHLLRAVVSNYSADLQAVPTASPTTGARHPAYAGILLGDKLVAETTRGFAAESSRHNGQAAMGLFEADKFVVQLVTAAFYAVPTLWTDQLTPLEWRLARLEVGLAKLGINRSNVTHPQSRALVDLYCGMLEQATPVVSPPAGSAVRGAAVVPLCAKPCEEVAKSIYHYYFEELLQLCDDMAPADEAEYTDGEEADDVSAPLEDGTESSAPTSSVCLAHADPEASLTRGSVGRTSSGTAFNIGVPIVPDTALAQRMQRRGLRASVRLAAQNSDRLVVGDGASVSRLSLKDSMRMVRGVRRRIGNFSPRCYRYHDPCRFIPAVRKTQVEGFAPVTAELDRTNEVYTAVIEGVVLRGYDYGDAVLQLDFLHPPQEVMRHDDADACPDGYALCFLYTGGSAAKGNQVADLAILSDDPVESLCDDIATHYHMAIAKAQWLTSPTAESFSVPGLIHFAVVDRRTNSCVAANFDAAIRNAADPDAKLGCRMLHEVMAFNMSRAHEMIARGFSEGLWGHLGVQFFYCITFSPEEQSIQLLQNRSALPSAATSRAASPEAAEPVPLGDGLLASATGSFRRGNVLQSRSYFIDAGTHAGVASGIAAAQTAAGKSVSKTPAGSPHQSRTSILFPEKRRLPLDVMQHLLYRPMLLPDTASVPTLVVYGLFVGALSPAEVCEATEILLARVCEA